MADRPPLLGLTGGIGAGKSAVLDAFAALGAATLSSDEVVHRLYQGRAVREIVVARFGDGVAREGEVDRAALGAAAFADPDGMTFLEDLLHPLIGPERESWIRECAALDPPPPALVCEVPLLFEAGLADAFDAVLVVTAAEDTRRARVEARGQDFDVRSARQLAEAEKITRADEVYVNDGSLEDLRAWAKEILRRWGTRD